ncbi:MAG: hypothetical protein OHK0056_13750 [Bacteriovoracaceae bacterium]
MKNKDFLYVALAIIFSTFSVAKAGTCGQQLRTICEQQNKVEQGFRYVDIDGKSCYCARPSSDGLELVGERDGHTPTDQDIRLIAQQYELSENQGATAIASSASNQCAAYRGQEGYRECVTREIAKRCDSTVSDIQFEHERSTASNDCRTQAREHLALTDSDNFGDSSQPVAATTPTDPTPRQTGDDSRPASGGSVIINFDSVSLEGLPSSLPRLRRGSAEWKNSSHNLNNTIGYSDFHKLCEAEMEEGKLWENIDTTNYAEIWKNSMDEFLYRAHKDLKDKKSSATIDVLNGWYDKYKAQIAERTEVYKRCAALRATMTGMGMDYNDDTVSRGTGNGGTMTVASVIKPDLKCQTKMFDTVDFKDCRAAINAFDALFVAEQGMGVYQQFNFMNNNQDRQMDLQKKQMQGQTIDTTDALGAQKAAIQDQAQAARQRAVFDGAKLGTLAMMLNKIPDQNKVKEACASNLGNANILQDWNTRVQAFKTWVEKLQIRLPSGTTNALSSNLTSQPSELANAVQISQAQNGQGGTVEEACNSFFARSSNYQVPLLLNQNLKEKIKAEMVKAGVSMASYLAKAALLDKQADQIEDVMNSIKKFEPPPFPEQQMTEMQVLECQANPQAEGCGTLNGARENGFYNGGINLGGSQFATSDGEAIDLNEPNASTNNSAISKTDRTDRSRLAGSAIADAPGEKGILNPVAAAEVKKGGGNPGASGGGGAGAGAGGGGGGAAGGKAAAGGQAAYSGGGLSKLKYGRGGNGSLSYSSGLGGGARKPAAKAENPFANLLGKPGNKTGVLDGFRGPASGIGNKDDGLFQMISNRYSRIAGDKDRLMQYEIKK